MKKIFKTQNVYDAALQRIGTIFEEFENICISFSGGKDSSAMLNLVLDYMRKNQIKRKVGVLFIDVEAQYQFTIEHVEQMLTDNRDLIRPYWVCLPINLRNAVSVYNPFWCCWEPDKRNNWVRPIPNHESVVSEQDFFPFYRYRMEFEQFVPEFGQWFGRGQRTAILVGIRSDESLNRFRTVASSSKKTLNGLKWTTDCSNNVYNAYPLYDWRTEDIWTANAKFGWDYNHLYDLFYKAGVGIHDMRICQPYGDDQRIGLNLFRVIEPNTWAKVVNRVSGANYGNIYCGSKMLGYRKIHLPNGHTWKSYTKLLLSSLPPETAANYRERFAKFIRYWRSTGCPVHADFLHMLPDSADITNDFGNRGKKNKPLVRFRKIPDTASVNVESSKSAPTWRRMAACILKNDHLCKGLSFSQTSKQVERIKELKLKYGKL